MTDTDRPSGGPVLAVEDVAHSFGDVSVLDDVDFALERGTVTALVGPNGSGKTTLLRIVAGLLSPTSGRVDRPEGSRTVGYLPQDPAFRSSFSVVETLDFYGSLLDGQVDVDAALERVGLAGVADRNVAALSGGMRRLLGVAQATLGDPDLVVLDEPTGDLDPGMTRYVFDVVADLADGGTTVLLATHNLAGAERADDLLVLDRGGIVESGPPAVVTRSVGADSLTAAFLEFVGSESGLSVRADMGNGESNAAHPEEESEEEGESSGEAPEKAESNGDDDHPSGSRDASSPDPDSDGGDAR